MSKRKPTARQVRQAYAIIGRANAGAGGAARWAKLSADERSILAKKLVAAREQKRLKTLANQRTGEQSNVVSEGEPTNGS